MEFQAVTYANPMAEFLGPLLLLIRATGFFEAYIFMPSMTLLAAYLYVELRHQATSNGASKIWPWHRRQPAFKLLCFSQCFLLTNAAAVALKTMIVEEMDYETYVWFIPYVSPLHIYIVSVVTAHLYLIWSNTKSAIVKPLCAYIQVGLLGGYSIGLHRLLHEPFELTDPTTGMSAYFLFAWFGLINLDIFARFRNKVPDAEYGFEPHITGGTNAREV